MWKAAVIGIVGLSSAGAQAADVPLTVRIVAASLETAGYEDVAVTLRVFGGYVLQGGKGKDFVMVALAADGLTLDQAEVFRDSDGDGVFGSDEALGTDDTRALRSVVTAALSDPKDSGGDRDMRGVAVEISGFKQRPESVFAGASLRASAQEVLGSGHVAATEKREVTQKDATGVQRRSVQTLQAQSMSGFEIRAQTASVIQPRGAPGEFLPLTFGGNFVDADAIRADAMLRSPDADSIRNSVMHSALDGEVLRSRIISGLPTAEAIRATIVTPRPQP